MPRVRGKKRSFPPPNKPAERGNADLPPKIEQGSLPQAMAVETPRFEDYRDRISGRLIDTITNDLHFDRMTPIQANTIDDLLQGKDVLAQARTGTGKTIAFTLPSIETILRQTKNISQALISILVLSPTRELALQTTAEAKKLTQQLSQFKIACAIGGTDKQKEARTILRGCQMLVATPGRLLDHLSDEEMRYQLSALKILVLDEADRMLDMGFLPDIKKILTCLPDKNKEPRQSMLFSATVPENVESVAGLILNKDYTRTSTIPKGEANTHERVEQYIVNVTKMTDLAPAAIAVIKSEIAICKDIKAIIFAPTAAHVDFYGHILRSIAGLPAVSVLHARLSQNRRTRVTEEFRQAGSAICVATDVIARGMDFPLVTHVIQCGLPMDRESYIHRLGRTARADAQGRGILILADAEKGFLHQLKGIIIRDYPNSLNYSMEDIRDCLTSYPDKKKAYQAFLGYYKTFQKVTHWSVDELVQEANRFAIEGLDCGEVPGLEKKIVGKMGLKGVRGLVVIPNAPGTNDSRRRGGDKGRSKPSA